MQELRVCPAQFEIAADNLAEWNVRNYSALRDAPGNVQNQLFARRIAGLFLLILLLALPQNRN